jgi:hypothetical protein
MSKFSKRIKKISKRPKNAFILGNGVGDLDDILEVFYSAFTVGDLINGQRRKNLIYLERIESIAEISEIDMLFIDRNNIDLIPKLAVMYKRCQPLIFIEGDVNIPNDLAKILVNDGYRVTDIEKRYHIWRTGRG